MLGVRREIDLINVENYHYSFVSGGLIIGAKIGYRCYKQTEITSEPTGEFFILKGERVEMMRDIEPESEETLVSNKVFDVVCLVKTRKQPMWVGDVIEHVLNRLIDRKKDANFIVKSIVEV